MRGGGGMEIRGVSLMLVVLFTGRLLFGKKESRVEES
jgi:hypothetical protein